VRPSKRTLALQCGPWARLGGAGEQNSSEVHGGLAGEGWGKGLGATRVRFGVLDRGVAAPASGSPAAREGWPLRLPMPGEGGSVGTAGGWA
jgi:hypothetical protein